MVLACPSISPNLYYASQWLNLASSSDKGNPTLKKSVLCKIVEDKREYPSKETKNRHLKTFRKGRANARSRGMEVPGINKIERRPVSGTVRDRDEARALEGLGEYTVLQTKIETFFFLL